MKEKILIVDDEAAFLSQFQAFLEAKGYTAIASNKPEEALKELDLHDIAVILSDQRMPKIKGVDLLKQIREKSPDSIRVLITAYSDIDAIIDAVNEGSIYRYIDKSLDPEEILLTIRQCIEKYHQDKQIRELSRANERLLRMLSAEDINRNLNIFGREVTQKMEEIIRGLSGYLFREAGNANHTSLKTHFHNLEEALGRLRALSESDHKPENITENADIKKILLHEIDILNQATHAFGLRTEIITDFEKNIPEIAGHPHLAKAIKEVLENAVLFGEGKHKKITVTLACIKEVSDAYVKVRIANPGKLPETSSSIFAPFYTTLGQVDFHPEIEEPKNRHFNLGPTLHFGIGLALAQSILASIGGWVTAHQHFEEVHIDLNIPACSQNG